MRSKKWIAGLSLVTLLSVGNLAIVGQQPQKAPKAEVKSDGGKRRIELPVKAVAINALPVVNRPSPKVVNPKVEPGKVKWHATMKQACAASRKSGKPVLLFQMMGKLDDQFC